MVYCVFYLVLTGALSFVAGRLLPKRWFCADLPPYRLFGWEQGGKIYEKIHIKSWQSKVPDMSKLFPGVMPRKQIDAENLQILPRMIQETCVAELMHLILCVTGLWCIKLWQGLGGWLVAVGNVAANLAFVAIQRYNRPRLMRLARAMARRQQHKEALHASSDSQL